jgi:hypothetical protein
MGSSKPHSQTQNGENAISYKLLARFEAKPRLLQ